MTQLEQYYREIWIDGMPPFDHLTPEQRNQLQRSANFAAWRLGQEMEKLKAEIGGPVLQICFKVTDKFTHKAKRQ